MGELIMQIYFVVIVLPILMIKGAYKKLKKFLSAKFGIEIDVFQAILGGLILVLIVLLLNGFRW